MIESHTHPSAPLAAGTILVPPPDAEPQRQSMLELLAQVLRHRGLLIWLPIGFSFLIGLSTVLSPKRYTTVVSFTPVASDASMAGGLASLAGQLGLGVPGLNPAESPDFYADLITTADILIPLVNTKYTVRDGDKEVTGTFIELNEIEESTPGRTMFVALKQMREKVFATTFDRNTSVVRATIKTKWPEMSFQMANRLLELINKFNLESRQTNGAAQRDFLRSRVDTAKAEMNVAENNLQGFLLRNRSFKDDPVLMFENERLSNELATRKEVYAAVIQAYEQARLTAVKNTPSISLMEHAMMPLRHDSRKAVLKVLLAFVGGIVMAIVIALGLEAFRQEAEQRPEAFGEIQSGVGSLTSWVPWKRRRAPA